MNFTGIAACHSFYWRRYYNSDSLIDAAESVFVQSSRTRSSRWSPYSRTTASVSAAAVAPAGRQGHLLTSKRRPLSRLVAQAP